ncbi:MAG: ribonuclease HII [Candidatus Levybacteria bacterium]|nr:ribonuclease HII [Candidatus Levybacteria bacterium]
MNSLPTLDHEIELWKKGYIVIGVDEVGRGAFAGPLFVGGVIFNPTTSYEQKTRLLSYGINDSKKLKPNARKMLSKIIQNESLVYHISAVNVNTINRIGIGKATFLAMRDVVKCLREKLKDEKIFVLIDKFYVKRLNGIGLKNQKGIIHGDEISLSIAAASIIAKVARDRHMRKLSAKYKVYGWGRNKGYGTKKHQEAIRNLGITNFHRKAFIKNLYSVNR